MEEIGIDGQTYRLAKLNALTQFHLARRIAPIVTTLDAGQETIEKLTKALAEMSDEEAEYVIAKCLNDCRRKSGDSWAKVFVSGNLMFDDIDMMHMADLVVRTLMGNLSGFFIALRSRFQPVEAS